MIPEETNYAEFFGNMKCDISSDSKSISVFDFPTIKVHIKYMGDNPIKIFWDDDFGYILWDGKFVIVSKSESGSSDTSNMKFKTSNTYPPRKTVELRKGDELTSILDFSKLPVSYEKSQLIHEKKFSLILCASNIDEKQSLKPISNELVFNEG